MGHDSERGNRGLVSEGRQHRGSRGCILIGNRIGNRRQGSREASGGAVLFSNTGLKRMRAPPGVLQGLH